MFKIHPSRAIRWRSDNTDYDAFDGDSKLKPCFDHLQLIQTMLHNMGNAVHRFAYGQPWIQTKGVRTEKDRLRIKNMIGNPLDMTYFQTPTESITDIKMLGVQTSQMDVSKLIQDNAQLVAASCGIPKPILMAEQIAMNKEGQIVDPEYFAAIDKEHVKQNKFIRQFVNSDPFFTRLFKKYDIKHFVINWGLRQVMTQMQQMDYDMRKANNAVAKSNYASFKEIRNYDGLPSWEDYFATIPNGTEECLRMFDITPRQLDMIPPNFLTFRQQGAQELVQTPAEQKTAERTQELAENNNPENVNRSQNGIQPGSQEKPKEKEVYRREMKNVRAGAKEGGKDLDEMSDDEIKDHIILELRNRLNNARVELSMRDLEEKSGIGHNKLYQIQDFLKNYK
jgi:ribosomal protein L29